MFWKIIKKRYFSGQINFSRTLCDQNFNKKGKKKKKAKKQVRRKICRLKYNVELRIYYIIMQKS